LHPAPCDNPRQWLADYLSARTLLGARDSDFRCDPACLRPGCRNPDLQVPVSLIDLLGVGWHLDSPVSDLFQRHYVLGLYSNDRDDWIRTVAVRLKKPCPFLDQDRCSIYEVRPLPCMLFPEHLVSRGTLAVSAAQNQFRDYLCLHRPLRLSSARAKAVARLLDLWEREMLVSVFYLFDHGSCHLDCRDLETELKRAGQSIITPRDLEQFFGERLAGFPPFAAVADKIGRLDNLEAQARFLHLLQNERLVKKLGQAGEDRALVFRFRKGKLRARRRGIGLAEYKFY